MQTAWAFCLSDIDAGASLALILVSHPNYILVYRHTVLAIEILNVLHARQQYPF